MKALNAKISRLGTVLLGLALVAGGPAGADEEEVSGTGFAAPMLPTDTADPGEEFVDPEGSHDPDEGEVFTNLSFYDLKEGTADDDKQSWRDSDYIHWKVNGAILDAWGQVQTRKSGSARIVSSEAWGNERIEARVDASEGDYGTIRAENEVVFTYNHMVTGSKIAEASVQLDGTAYDIKGKAHTFHLSDQRSEAVTTTTDEKNGLSIHEYGSLSGAFSNVSGLTAKTFGASLGIGLDSYESLDVNVTRRNASAGGDNGGSPPAMVRDTVSGRTPLAKTYDVFSDGAVVLRARSSADDEEDEGSEVLVLLRKFKIKNSLRVWKSAVLPAGVDPGTLEPPPSDPAPGPETPGETGQGDIDPGSETTPTPSTLFPELDWLSRERRSPPASLGEFVDLEATVAVREPYGLDGERGAMPGYLKVKLSAPAPRALEFAFATEPRGLLQAPEAGLRTVEVKAGERWGVLSVHGLEPGEGALTLQPLDLFGDPVGDAFVLPLAIASTASRPVTRIWATVSERPWQPGSGVRVIGPCSSDIGPLRIGRLGFAGFAQTSTTVDVEIDDPDGVLEPMPGTVVIPAGETSVHLPLRLTDETGTAVLTLRHGDDELRVTITGEMQRWRAPGPVRLPVGSKADVVFQLALPERTPREVVVESGDGVPLAFTDGAQPVTLHPGERCWRVGVSALEPGATTVLLRTAGLLDLEVPVEIVAESIRVEAGSLRISGISAAALGTIGLEAAAGVRILSLDLPAGSEEWLSVDGLGTEAVILSFTPSPDMPVELDLPVEFGFEGTSPEPLELTVLDTLHAPQGARSFNTFRIAVR